MSNQNISSLDIEGQDKRLAHEAEEQTAYEEKHIREVEFEKVTNKPCFDPTNQQCLNGCEPCPKNHPCNCKDCTKCEYFKETVRYTKDGDLEPDVDCTHPMETKA